MQLRARQHLGILFAAFTALLVVVATLNALVDPYAAHGWIDLESLRPYRVRLISRVAKAELLDRERCEVAILGTSRAQIALDPDYAGWDGASVCNLALTGAGLAELEHVYRYALRHDTLRQVWFEVDLFDRRTPHEDFGLSLFNPDLHPFDYASSLLLGANATRASLRVIRDLHRNRKLRSAGGRIPAATSGSSLRRGACAAPSSGIERELAMRRAGARNAASRSRSSFTKYLDSLSGICSMILVTLLGRQSGRENSMTRS